MHVCTQLHIMQPKLPPPVPAEDLHAADKEAENRNTHQWIRGAEPRGFCSREAESSQQHSSLQSSLNSTNRICYRCKGRNKRERSRTGMWFPGWFVYVCVCGSSYVCVFAVIEKYSAGSPYLSIPPSSRECILLDFPFYFCWALHALLFSLPSFLCFSAAVVTTCSIVDWITEQLELVLYFSTRDRIINKQKSVWCVGTKGPQPQRNWANLI